MKKRDFYLVTFFSIALVTACSSRNGLDSKTLHVQLANEPVSLDPSLAEDGVSIRVLMNVIEGLYVYDAEGRLVPNAFSEKQTSADFKHFEFTLKPDLKWSDGSPIQAEDFVTGIRHSLSPSVPAKLAELLLVIKNAREYKSGKEKNWAKVGLKAVGNHLIFELEESAPWFIHVLALPIASPRKSDDAFVAGKTPTNGIYQFASVERGKFIRLTANSNHRFWIQPTTGAPAAVELWIVSDETTAMRLFEKGKLDVLTRISPLELKRLAKISRVEAFPLLATYYIGLNVKDPWLRDPIVRRGFAASIQKDQVVAALRGSDVPSRGWIPENLEGYVPYGASDSISSQKAIQVARAWLKKRKPSSVFKLIYDQSSVNQIVAEKIQSDIKKNLGVDIKLQASDWKSHIKNLSPLNASAFRFGWLSPFMDPIANLKAFTNGGANNYTGWKDSHYDLVVRQASQLPPGQQRLKLILEAQKILVEDQAAIVPIFHYRLNHAFSKRTQNTRVNPLSVLLFHTVQLNGS